MSETLFGGQRRRRGACEALLQRTMRAWSKAGHLVGDEHASARGVLRDAARAVDQARDDMHAGEGTAYSFARCNELYRQALTDLARTGAEGGEDPDAWLTDLGATVVRDGEDA